uniref:Thiol oxidase n=1 Tax=viral metagenome TaxID=1070528 RepID=A0A6M3JGI8_9ZZZZ
MSATFEIDGYHVVLPHIQNVYPVEKELNYYHWGFKYLSQVFEYFSYQTKDEAEKIHNAFIKALNQYWKKHNQSFKKGAAKNAALLNSL